MRSVRDRIDETMDDPKKLRRAFNIIWVIAYSMLIIGFILIVLVLVAQIA